MTSTLKAQKGQEKVNLIVVACVGATRGGGGLLIEHPFDTLKTWMQSSNQTPYQALTQIYQKKGIKGFYSGFKINFLRAITKQAYRWPLNFYLISRFRQKLKSYNYHNAWAGFAAGAVTALIESIIICPFERIKIWMMTSQKLTNYHHFVQTMALKNLFDGYSSVLIRQIISWVTFLGAQQSLKEMIYRYKGKSRAEYQLNMYDLTLVSVLVCFINTFFVMPIDYVKTHYQKYYEIGDRQKKISMAKFILKTYQQGGIKRFYMGTSVKIIHYNINSFLTVPIFEKMLRKYDY